MSSISKLQRRRARLPLAPLPVGPEGARRDIGLLPNARHEHDYRGPLISVRMAARTLRVHPTTVRRRAARGEITLHQSMVGLGVTEEDLARARRRPPRRGRPAGKAEATPDVAERVVGMQKAGLSYAEIARRLNADGVPTARGGRQWWPSSVRSLCATLDARAS